MHLRLILQYCSRVHPLLVIGNADVRLTQYLVARDIRPMCHSLSRSVCGILMGAWNIRNAVKSDSWDAVHLHSSFAGLVGRLGCLGLPVTVIYAPHCVGYWLPNRASRLLAMVVERILAARTDVFLAVSEAEARHAMEAKLATVDSIAVIPNSIPRPARAVPSRDSSTVRFAFLGDLRFQKAPDTFLRAAALVVAEKPYWKLQFVLPESGPLAKEMRNLVRELGLEDCVQFLPCPNGVADMFAGCTMAVLPSRWEGLPYALLEAMNGGLVVIASDIPVFRDYLGSSSTELIFPVDDYKQLALRMAAWAAAPDAVRLKVVHDGWRYIDHVSCFDKWQRQMALLYVEAARSGRVASTRRERSACSTGADIGRVG